MSLQRALVIPAERQPFKLVSDWPIPKPGPKDVLVKLISIALNPADWRVESGTARGFVKEYPVICGLDGAGVIEEIGSKVTHLAKGDKVLFEGWFDEVHGTFQEYALSPAAYTAKIPDNISFDRAATVPICLATVNPGIWAHDDGARSARFTPPWEEGGKTKYAGDVAFIVGGSSSVGQYAIQCARMQGYAAIIATSSLKHQEFLKSLGATHIIDRNLPPGEIQAQVRTFAAGKPITYVYDAIGEPEEQRLSYELLADGGAFVTVQPFFHEYLEDLVTENEPVIRVYGTFDVPENYKLGSEVYSRLPEWLATGVIVPNRAEVVLGGLAGIPGGLERLRKGKVAAYIDTMSP
ncbi:GroES-like protein [Dichomitus squalens]|uniref:GroES-like protein n=1 Tax=Dichomitus squalens TaxID=114155 RepID=A0A4Q9PIN6_9APHY|nr:GroES-like protein [Dichomitus squalens]TBU53916.1 GroES-like protein [Dichomitus squalens]